MTDRFDYSLTFPLTKMSIAEQERFWLIEGRIRQKANFDTGFTVTKRRGTQRHWELDFSLDGDLSTSDIMFWLQRESIMFSVRVSIADEDILVYDARGVDSNMRD